MTRYIIMFIMLFPSKWSLESRSFLIFQLSSYNQWVIHHLCMWLLLLSQEQHLFSSFLSTKYFVQICYVHIFTIWWYTSRKMCMCKLKSVFFQHGCLSQSATTCHITCTWWKLHIIVGFGFFLLKHGSPNLRIISFVKDHIGTGLNFLSQ